MASDLNKPNGQAVITPERGPQFVAELAVKNYHGVGPATAAKMERLGILTGADLREKSPVYLREHFGKSGDWYYRISRGIDNRPVEPNRERKSLGAEDTFDKAIFSLDQAKAEIAALSARVWRSCEAKGLTGRTVTLKVKYADFQQVTRSRTIVRSLRESGELSAVASALLRVFPVRKGVRLLGVTLSSLGSADDGQIEQQLSLIPPSP